ncbi:MAG TPA: hypothetical protein PKC22_09090, partial [Rhodocyclaceae bacterium]|nr:hypothetical protein [Rhodocyclaceae bacterium]
MLPSNIMGSKRNIAASANRYKSKNRRERTSGSVSAVPGLASSEAAQAGGTGPAPPSCATVRSGVMVAMLHTA